MRHAKVSRDISVQPKTSTVLLLAEGLVKGNIQITVKSKYRNWQAMSNDEVIAYAKTYCAEKGIKKISELAKGSNKNTGLCYQLQKRNLVCNVFERKKFEEVTLDDRTFRIPLNAEGNRNWITISDDEIVAYARAYCKERKITKSSELEKGENADNGLYLILRKRKNSDGTPLFDQVFERKKFEEVTLAGRTFRILLNAEGNRKWETVSDDEITAYAKAYIAEKGIKKPFELQKGPNKNSGLSHQIYKRKLTDRVFLDIRTAHEASALSDIASALVSFGGSGK
ncbi:MAG: hypothetical protein Q7S22_06235 [Candidatus Micrarchaeota archaeon]|nr:hypothetical protein [Candidatus Micrarchaeota archaeon]